MNNVTIGIPRGLLYYKYKYLWTAFFRELGINILVSPSFENYIYNDRYYLKNYYLSIKYLNGKVDYIFIARIDNENICFYFNSLFDIINNKFDISLVSLNIDKKTNEELAYIKLGEQLGFSKNYSLNAYKNAKLEEYKYNKIDYLLDMKKIKKDTKKILLIGEEYIYNIEQLNEIIKNAISENNITIINSNNINPDRYNDINSYKDALINNINTLESVVNGVIFITTYPCVYKNINFIKNLHIKILEININQNLNIEQLKEDINIFLEKIKMETDYE